MRIPLQLIEGVHAILPRGNIKLGQGIFTWSLPAAMTCPGRSQLCEGLCYALKYRFLSPKYIAQVIQNWIMANLPFFEWWMVRKITAAKAAIVRIHVSGDMYSAKYARQWRRVAEALPNVRFYCYTRSWRVPEIAEAVEELSNMPNVRVFYSVDRETGVPKNVPANVRLAYLMVDEGDKPPGEADLVFLDYPVRHGGAKRFNGVLGCPAETVGNVTCTKCQLCIAPLHARDPRRYKQLPAVA